MGRNRKPKPKSSDSSANSSNKQPKNDNKKPQTSKGSEKQRKTAEKEPTSVSKVPSGDNNVSSERIEKIETECKRSKTENRAKIPEKSTSVDKPGDNVEQNKSQTKTTKKDENLDDSWDNNDSAERIEIEIKSKQSKTGNRAKTPERNRSVEGTSWVDYSGDYVEQNKSKNKRTTTFDTKTSQKKISADEEFDQFWKQFDPKKSRDLKYLKVREIQSDLFDVSEEHSLGHCVAEDMGMGSGIAVEFRHKFKRVDELLNQRQKQGGLAVLSDKDRYIYYLVTKRLSNGKPLLQNLFSSLTKLRTHMEENNVRKLAVPRIGCGLDRLEWSEVKPMVEFVFKETKVEEIVVCNIQNFGKPKQKLEQVANKNAKETSKKMSNKNVKKRR